MSEVRLIDANALFEAFSNSNHIKETTSGLDVMEMLAIKEIIDNAPTVENITIFCENTDEKTIEELKAELEQVRRPQGEWLWLGDSSDHKHRWSCNKCGRGVKEEENFCPNCGVKMQKGGAE